MALPMRKYEIIYAPNSTADRAGLETEVEATSYQVQGRFVTFYRMGEGTYGAGDVILRVASTQVLQVKMLSDEE